MTTLEEVKSMQNQGIVEEQIVQALREKGRSYREIADALAQSRIKAAVEQPLEPEAGNYYPDTQSTEGMQQSIMTLPPAPIQTPQQQEPYQDNSPIIPQYQEQPLPVPMPQSESQQQYPQSQFSPQTQEQYPSSAYDASQQYAQSSSISQDIVSEIADQIVTEKFSEIKKHLEKVIDFRTSIDSKVESIDDRLKRIEKVIDTLQSSVLRKVGDYVTNVQDLKSELVETQKTFSKLLPERKHTQSQRHHNSQEHHPQNHPQSQHHEHKK